jgi:predicted alpha/beta-hydrolase family hydrolase
LNNAKTKKSLDVQRWQEAQDGFARYPFHPVGKPDRLRVEHLQTIKTPTLITQGERDPFGTGEDVAGYRLSSAVRIQWIEDGDHSLKPRKASGRTEKQNWDAAIKEIVTFLKAL